MNRPGINETNRIDRACGEAERMAVRSAAAEDEAKFPKVNGNDIKELLCQVCALTLLNLEDMGVKHFDVGIDILECIHDPAGKNPVLLEKFDELKKRLAEAVATLQEMEKIIVSLYYYEELTFREIGNIMDITESMVCQLHSQILLRLKAG